MQCPRVRGHALKRHAELIVRAGFVSIARCACPSRVPHAAMFRFEEGGQQVLTVTAHDLRSSLRLELAGGGYLGDLPVPYEQIAWSVEIGARIEQVGT